MAKIQGIHSGGIVGKIVPYGGTSIPAYALACQGQAVSRTTYATLFTAIGTTYGSGDGSTTFNLPNAQGVFLRGAGSQTISSVSYSATQGTTQGDQMQGHAHTFYWGNSGSGSVVNSGSLYNGSSQANSDPGSISGPLSDGTNGTPRTGTETRPANIAVNYCIVFQ